MSEVETRSMSDETDPITEFAASYVDVIETVIDSLDQDNSAMVNHDDEGHLWKFRYGTVDVYVQLTGVTDEDTLTVWSPILKLPVQNQEKLLHRLLEMNCGSTFEACFGISNQEVLILASRILADINPGEISRLMTVVATLADEQDETLRAEYPGK